MYDYLRQALVGEAPEGEAPAGESLGDEVPRVVLDILKRRAGFLAVINMHRARELLRVVQRFEAAGVPAIPIKGPALGAIAYGDVALRPAFDLDVLVQPGHFKEAVEILQCSGYDSVTCPDGSDAPSEGSAAFAEKHQSCELYHPTKQVPLELHYGFFPHDVSEILPMEAVWARHRRRSFLGASVRSLAPEDRLIYLCAHGTWHRWAKLKWVADVAGLLARTEALNEDALRRRAENGGTLRRVRLGMGLARELLGAPVPAGWRHDLAGDPVLPRLIDTVRSQWLYTYRTTDADPWTTLRFQLRARERWRDQWAFLRRQLPLLLNPSERDRAAFPLPEALDGVYVFIRPIRVLWNRMTSPRDEARPT